VLTLLREEDKLQEIDFKSFHIMGIKVYLDDSYAFNDVFHLQKLYGVEL
jgi:hypothetical protein